MKTTKLVNPRRKKNGVIYTLLNPRKTMAHRKHKKSYRSRWHTSLFGKSRNRKHRSNPFRRRHHRNPMGQSNVDILKLAGGALVGVVGSGYLSQMALGANNSGVIGYASDAVATLALAWAANKFVGGKVGEGVLAGGFGALLKRIWQENVSGNVAMSGWGNSDFLRGYASRNFALPTSTASGAYQLQAAPGTPVTAAPATAGTVGQGAVSSAVQGTGARYGKRYGAAA